MPWGALHTITDFESFFAEADRIETLFYVQFVGCKKPRFMDSLGAKN